MLALKFPCHLSGSVLFGRKRACAGDRNRQRDDCPHGSRARPLSDALYWGRPPVRPLSLVWRSIAERRRFVFCATCWAATIWSH